jgi:hypothetical protein
MPSNAPAESLLVSSAQRWRDRCLLSDRSVLTDEYVWTLDNIRQLILHYVENPDLSDRTFFDKLKDQLSAADPGARKLAAEMLWVMYLIVHESAMHAATKRLQIEKVWSWSGEPVPDDPHLLDEALAAGVVHPGTAFHTHRWRELVFFVRLMEEWKKLPVGRHEELTADGWEFARWVDSQEESKGRQLRHILLFLLFPDLFEPSVVSQHKWTIVRRWYPEVVGNLADVKRSDRLAVDRALHQVKLQLQKESPEKPVDFYQKPWVGEWRKGSEPETDGTTSPDAVDSAAADQWALATFGDARVWVMAAGDGGRLWPEFKRNEIIALGLDGISDLSEFDSKEELSRTLSEARGVANPFNDTLAGWQFAHEMQAGDHVIAKEGRSKLLGWGVIKSGYRYDPDRPEYRNVRDVEWRVTGRWTLPENQTTPLKTLTDFTSNRQWLHMAIHLMMGGAPPPPPNGNGYPLDRAMRGLFLSEDRFTQILDLLGRKKNVVLQGPPGVGKTFIARRVAYRLMDKADPSRVKMVQFHQAYAYEDFVQGYRPTDEGGFRLKNGVFYEFCRRASADPDQKYVFIIDEINRGNLARILGELMLLIEGDKRDSAYALPLTYATDPDDTFHVPDNLYILGMMNTADRSLAMVDYALRRRFGFVTLRPEFQSEAFAEYLMEAAVPKDLVGKIEGRMTALNEAIIEDQKNLGPGFEIGHSYFVPAEEDSAPDEEWYARVIRTEIEPLLREYWFDDPKRVDDYVGQLLA